MAHIPGFKYDIYISYNHHDNQSPTDAPGRVDIFHNALESWLRYRRGFSDLSIWRDKELDSNTKFNAAIRNKIKNSAIFFVLHSRNYQQSDYCRQQLQWFHDYHRDRVGVYYRIFNILINNIPHQQWPVELGQTSGFAMHDAQSFEELGDFTSPNDERFEKQLRRIVDATEMTFAEFSKLQLAMEDPLAQENEVKIFVADAADSLQDFRERIIAELVGQKGECAWRHPTAYGKRKARRKC